MSFFDSKEEIINIELTSYGKYLLSKGKFKPYYYAFFDDDILYDAAYASITESQNDTQNRILNETPFSKPQTRFVGTEKTISRNQQLVLGGINDIKEDEQQFSSEKNYSLTFPLGKSSYNSDYAPAWNVRLISGSISSSNFYIDNYSGDINSIPPYLKIPQINFLTNSFDVRILKESADADSGYESIGQSLDNANFAFSKPSINLIDILEINTDDQKQNFEIEVFMKSINTDATTGNIEWKQLFFKKKPVYIKNNILLDIPENLNNNLNPEIDDSTFVEHFFELLVDEEIELPPELKAQINIYDSDVRSIPLCPDPSNPCCPDLQR